MNYIINENKKNLELIRNDILSLHKKFDKLSINKTIPYQELQHENGKYIGPVVNGLAEGKGNWYGTKEPFIGDRYEGEFRNNKKEGRGIYYLHNGNIYEGDIKNGKIEGRGIDYYNNGDRYEGDNKNGLKEGKGIYYYNNGDRYEGDWKNDKREGKGIFYYNNGDREMGDYLNGFQIGIHVKLTQSGDITKSIF